MNLTLPRYVVNKKDRGNVDNTIPRPYPDTCFIVNVWDVPILTHPRNNFRENSVSAWATTINDVYLVSNNVKQELISTTPFEVNNNKVSRHVRAMNYVAIAGAERGISSARIAFGKHPRLLI